MRVGRGDQEKLRSRPRSISHQAAAPEGPTRPVQTRSSLHSCGFPSDTCAAAALTDSRLSLAALSDHPLLIGSH